MAMNFREATDAFLAHPRSIGTIARSMERSEASIRAARDGIRKDPSGWEAALAALAWAESKRMRALAQALSGEPRETGSYDEPMGAASTGLQGRGRASSDARSTDTGERHAPAATGASGEVIQLDRTGNVPPRDVRDARGVPPVSGRIAGKAVRGLTHGRNSTGKTGEDPSGEERGQAEGSEGAGKAVRTPEPERSKNRPGSAGAELGLRTQDLMGTRGQELAGIRPAPVTKESQTKRGRK